MRKKKDIEPVIDISQPLPGRLTPRNLPKQIGALGEYRVDEGAWRAITGARCPLPDGGHAVEVLLYGWCRYVAAVRGAKGAFDAFALPLHYQVPAGRQPPAYAQGHTLVADTAIEAVVYCTPEPGVN